MKMGRMFKGVLICAAWVFAVNSANAATFTVTSTNDNGPGTLRQAILDAANGDTIVFSLSACPCTIFTTTGLQIGENLTITGPGTNMLIIDGRNKSDAGGIFTIATAAVVVMEGVTITRSAGLFGGGIWNSGDLRLRNSVVSENQNAIGGFTNSGTLTIENSTVIGNSSFNGGGGIDNSGTTTVINSTISTNSGVGGGLRNSGMLTVVNSTITNNRHLIGLSPAPHEGGGIKVTSGTVILRNTIVAGNLRPDLTADDIFGVVFDARNNLIGSASTAGGIQHGVNGNIVGVGGVGTVDVATVLNPLADNGGMTPSHALAAGSPAINEGNNALAADPDNNPLTTDQRGAGFSAYQWRYCGYGICRVTCDRAAGH